jgi:hypothetical protein
MKFEYTKIKITLNNISKTHTCQTSCKPGKEESVKIESQKPNK